MGLELGISLGEALGAMVGDSLSSHSMSTKSFAVPANKKFPTPFLQAVGSFSGQKRSMVTRKHEVSVKTNDTDRWIWRSVRLFGSSGLSFKSGSGNGP